MKKILPLLFLLLIALSTVAFAAYGQVVYYNTNSYSIVIATNNGYTVGNVSMFKSGMWELNRGDMLAGELESFGVQDVYDMSRDRGITLWIDNFWLTEDQAIDWMQNH